MVPLRALAGWLRGLLGRHWREQVHGGHCDIGCRRPSLSLRTGVFTYWQLHAEGPTERALGGSG